MNFMEAIEKEILDNYNVSITENGAIGYKTTGNHLLDMNFKVSSYRSVDDATIINDFRAAMAENPILALKWLFFTRDIRGGLGERRFFKVAFTDLCKNNPITGAKLIPLVAEYGRWDDLWPILDLANSTKDTVTELVKAQMKTDMANALAEKEISLLAKWMPSANASSKDSKRWAHMFISAMNTTERNYRKTLSKLRAYLDVVERKMSANNWNEIKYEIVPSRANIMYKDAFMKHDEARRNMYLEALSKGETKINASVLFPHDIVHKYTVNRYGWSGAIKEYDEALEAMWKALPDMVNKENKTIVVADGSGSMRSCVGNSDVTALSVANALAVYFAEHSSGEYANKYITFSSHPQFVNFREDASLRDKLIEACRHNEVANTNIKAVFELILRTALDTHATQDDLPANILIISDMEFDYATTGKIDKSMFGGIKEMYESYGYKLPRLVFWNVCSRTNTIPVRNNDLGVALVSGFSPNICKMVMSGKTDPYECLLESLNVERYQAIEEALKAE